MHVLLLSRYARLGASSRLRSHQYLPYLIKAGVEVTVAPLFGDNYVQGLYSGNISKLAVLYAYFLRLRFILKARQFDLIWLEKEMLPWLPGWVELNLLSKKVPLVVDYDDAIFHRYDQHRFSFVRKIFGQKIDAVMRRANLVVVGNEYLGERAKQAGAKHIELLPTVVDVSRYSVIDKTDISLITIGWIGQPATAKYLAQLAPVLKKIMAIHHVRVVAIGPKPELFQDLAIEVRPWSEDTEVGEIQQFDIGIMPLCHDLWEQGKCGYKLIQYMACGLPVIASPVGVNSEIIEQGLNGYLAKTHTDWMQGLNALLSDKSLRQRMGQAGRKKIESEYSLQVTGPRLATLIKNIAAEQKF